MNLKENYGKHAILQFDNLEWLTPLAGVGKNLQQNEIFNIARYGDWT